VRAIPALVGDARATELFRDALSNLSDGGADEKDAVLRALASRAATANGEPLDDTDAQRIVAGVWPNRDAHRCCIVARVPLVSRSTEDEHA
jgi:hypothetical protein